MRLARDVLQLLLDVGYLALDHLVRHFAQVGWQIDAEEARKGALNKNMSCNTICYTRDASNTRWHLVSIFGAVGRVFTKSFGWNSRKRYTVPIRVTSISLVTCRGTLHDFFECEEEVRQLVARDVGRCDGLGDGQVDREGKAVAVKVVLARLRDALEL
eukprot:4017030-Pleurochrysis_carterae.AAC.1